MSSSVEKAYNQLKAMAVNFDLKPGARLNEGELAVALGVSRTPLREALNRLNTEGFLRGVPGKGFFCRDLDVQEVFGLFELRKALEVAAISLAVTRAKDEDIEKLSDFLTETGPQPGGRSVDELVQLDEIFHENLMKMAENPEMLRVLSNINERIRFVRWIDMERRDRTKTQAEHRAIIDALRARDSAKSAELLGNHIERRLDQITSAIKEAYAHIYMRA